jgi:hypothetical protein
MTSSWRCERGWVVRRAGWNRLVRVRYGNILRAISRVVSHRPVRISLEGHSHLPGYVRVVVRCRLPCALVDIFFNSAGGYRAQFCGSQRHAELANRAVVNSVRRSISSPVPPHCVPFLCASLLAPTAKAWIRQDFRYRRKTARSDRVLRTVKWSEPRLPSPYPGCEPWRAWWFRRERKLYRWGQVAPLDISEMVVYGGWIHKRNYSQLSIAIGKPGRYLEIHRRGFT